MRAQDEDGEETWAQSGSLQRDTLGSQGRAHAAPQGFSVPRAHVAVGRRKTLAGGESSSCQKRRGLPVKAGHSHSALHLPPLQRAAACAKACRQTCTLNTEHDGWFLRYTKERFPNARLVGSMGPRFESPLRARLKGGMARFNSPKKKCGLDAYWLELESVLADSASHFSSTHSRQEPSEKGRRLPYWDEWQGRRLPHRDERRPREASAPPSMARSEPAADRPRTRTPARSPRCPPQQAERTCMGGWGHHGVFTHQLEQLRRLCVGQCVNRHATSKTLPPSPRHASTRISSAHADPAHVRS